METQIKLLGYDLLGHCGTEGTRYAWKASERTPLLESASFINKSKGKKEHISGYTTSVSMGCILKPLGYACKFCRTGAVLPYTDMLSAYDIAKENIFMVLMDMKNPYNINSKYNQREFAYMGQGEPGYSYAQLRLAIKITDYAMKVLEQQVYRHIISTSGIPEMIYAVTNDIKNHYFDSKITLHYSLHSTTARDKLMPINRKYPYQDVLNALRGFSTLTGEKVCIGFLLLNDFSCKNSNFTYTTSVDDIDILLDTIESENFRISLCEYNSSTDVGNCKLFSCEKAKEILQYIKDRGYEVKLFSSFGQKENAACGLLGGQKPQNLITEEIIALEKYSDDLVKEAFSYI